ncbi:MAG TPA: PadR family transcriptional regulator [Vicinamibacterales bacterium]|jgi:DNA-binding PadR family transcriptional regulator|nr:PadR family transcriptional regulator [Vicinamibacterales bacterium]
MKGDHIGEFEELVLIATRGLGREAYGVSVQQLLERETTRAVSLGAVYAALDRLERKGLVRSTMTPGTSERGGRSRRVFVVTADGARTLAALQRIRDRLYRAGRARPQTARS